MFWEALLKLVVVALFLPVPIAAVWLIAYQFCSYLLPDWLTGLLAVGITWTRQSTNSRRAAVVIVGSAIVNIWLWSYLWMWTLVISLVACSAFLLTAHIYDKP
jgi:hypothetical protein